MTLVSDHVYDYRPLPFLRAAEGVLHGCDVVAVDRTGVSHPERLEKYSGFDGLTQRGRQADYPGSGQRADLGELL